MFFSNVSSSRAACLLQPTSAACKGEMFSILSTTFSQVYKRKPLRHGKLQQEKSQSERLGLFYQKIKG